MALKTKTLTQGRHALSFMLQPGDPNISFDNVTLVAGNILPPGSVVGKLTAGGKFTTYNNSNSDGSNIAAGVLCYAADSTDGDVAVVVAVRMCEVIADELKFPSGTSGSDITAALADLTAIGVIPRPSTYVIPSP